MENGESKTVVDSGKTNRPGAWWRMTPEQKKAACQKYPRRRDRALILQDSLERLNQQGDAVKGNRDNLACSIEVIQPTANVDHSRVTINIYLKR